MQNKQACVQGFDPVGKQTNANSICLEYFHFLHKTIQRKALFL